MERSLFSQTLPELIQNDTIFDSRYTHLTEPESHNNWFNQQRNYCKAVLSTWGLSMGELPYSRDNEFTLRCLLQLISYRQKDLHFRAKIKDDVSTLSFEKDKYRSFMEQSQRSLQQVTRRLGRSENQCAELRNRERKGEVTSRKQKEQDKKMMAMLKAKNEQILHEIKKKEQEVSRIKEQMKKTVGEKTLPAAKNSFQVYESLSPSKKEPAKQEELKYAFLLEHNERELAQAVRENSLMREKLFEIRQELLNFNEWVDRELFGENDLDKFKRSIRFPFNHNLLFKKESLTQELFHMLDTARNGIRQLRELSRGGHSFSEKKSLSSNLLPLREDIEDLRPRKALRKVDSIKSDRSKQSDREDFKEPRPKKPFPKAEPASQNITPKSFKKFAGQQVSMGKVETPEKGQKELKGEWKGRVSLEESKLPFEDELLSDVGENSECSIVSHIEVEKLGKHRFDKWDILYNDDEQ